MFSRDYNSILEEILTSYRNMGSIVQLDAARLAVDLPEIYNQYLIESPPDTSKGSLLFMKAAVYASMLYGLYETADRISEQIFVDTAIRQFKERHAADIGIPTINKTDLEIVQEVHSYKRSRLMGGNQYDYEEWARDVLVERDNGQETVISARTIKLARGDGTFDVVITSNLNNGVPSQALIDAVYTVLTERRTVCSGEEDGLRVLGLQRMFQDVMITGLGSQWNKARTVADITSYINSLKIAQPLYITQLTALAIQNGAENPVVSVPANDVIPVIDTIAGVYNVIRPGQVTIL